MYHITYICGDFKDASSGFDLWAKNLGGKKYWGKLLKYQENSPWVIISLILMTSGFD